MTESSVTQNRRVVGTPDDFRDRGADWYEYWDRERQDEIRAILREHPEIIEEHEKNPTGYREFHSPPLQRVLNYMRTQPALGKYFVYTNAAWRDYRIAIIVNRGESPRMLDDAVYSSEEEAMHAVFVRRVEDLLTVDK